MKYFFYLFIGSICFLTRGANSIESDQQQPMPMASSIDSPIHSVASLSCYLQAQCSEESGKNPISFTDEQVNLLWDKAYYLIHNHSLMEQVLFQNALNDYQNGKEFLSNKDFDLANHSFEKSRAQLNALWKKLIEVEDTNEINALNEENDFTCVAIFKRNADVIDSTKNRYIPASIQKQMKPFLISSNHEMKPVLDRLFATRITQDKKTLLRAGFKIVDRRSRSFICVVSHPDLSGYLIKLHLDNDKRMKQGKPSWAWLVKRCQGAEKIHQIIHKYAIKHFVCAKKWIYCLPENPAPPSTPKYTRHLAVLLVQDMQLIPAEENYATWKNKITKEQLNELYILVTRGKGSSYRPDNLPFTKNGKIAFIDTEYPDRGPDFESIREYLNREMRNYWDKIVSNGGY